MQRVVVMGAAGAGKTTLARRIADRLGVPHADFDPLYWLPGWVPADRVTLLARVASATDGPAWVVSGNYLGSAGPVAWARADTIVWLDLPRRVSMTRLLIRTARTAHTRAELWPGCRQDWATAFRTKLFSYGWRQTGNLRRSIPHLVAAWETSGIRVIRLTSTRSVRRFESGVRST